MKFNRLCLLLLISTVFQTTRADIRDALAPLSTPAEALTEQLHTVTVSTTSLNQSLLFYRDGMGLSVEGPIELPHQLRKQQRRLWQIPEDIDWQLYILSRPDVPEAAQIRLLVLNKPTPSIHQSWNALELGPFSMGFPNTNQIAQDKHLRTLGFGALNVIEKYQVPRTDGSQYDIHETIFNGPDFVHGVGIYRGNGMTQLGPVSTKTGKGGPAYSAQVVADSDKVLNFYINVLGMELRSDRIWKSAGSDGALNVPDGTVFRFSIVYAKGSRSGHLLFVDYKNRDAIDPGIAPRLPNRGIGMWSFPVTDLNQVLNNARRAGIEITANPTHINSPALGNVKAATMLAPNGFMVELFETTQLHSQAP
jgi:catechol 2,3-dioxygenase-like lactoylglutathione lyase family enzyme